MVIPSRLEGDNDNDSDDDNEDDADFDGFFLPGLLSAWLDLRGWSGAVGSQWREDQLLWEGFS